MPYADDTILAEHTNKLQRGISIAEVMYRSDSQVIYEYKTDLGEDYNLLVHRGNIITNDGNGYLYLIGNVGGEYDESGTGQVIKISYNGQSKVVIVDENPTYIAGGQIIANANCLWVVSGWASYTARAQRFSLTGTLLTTVLISNPAGGSYEFMSIDILADNSIVVVQAEKATGSTAIVDLWVKHYDEDGTLLTTIASTPGDLTRGRSAVFMSGTNEVIVQNQTTGLGSGNFIVGRHFDLSGTLLYTALGTDEYGSGDPLDEESERTSNLSVRRSTDNPLAYHDYTEWLCNMNHTDYFFEGFGATSGHPGKSGVYHKRGGLVSRDLVTITGIPSVRGATVNELDEIFTTYSGDFGLGGTITWLTRESFTKVAHPITEWFRYPYKGSDVGKVSLSPTFDGAFSVPNNTDLVGRLVHYFELRDMRAAFEAIVVKYRSQLGYPDGTGNTYNLTPGDADNFFQLYFDNDSWADTDVDHGDEVEATFYNELHLAINTLEGQGKPV